MTSTVTLVGPRAGVGPSQAAGKAGEEVQKEGLEHSGQAREDVLQVGGSKSAGGQASYSQGEKARLEWQAEPRAREASCQAEDPRLLQWQEGPQEDPTQRSLHQGSSR